MGFPGETEAHFDETLSLLEEVRYDSLFAFKYSPRPNTPSLAMKDSIPEEEKEPAARRSSGKAARNSDGAERRIDWRSV